MAECFDAAAEILPERLQRETRRVPPQTKHTVTEIRLRADAPLMLTTAEEPLFLRPGGRCGALHAALRITPEDKHEAIIQAFVAQTGSELCKEIKTVCKTPCTKCVEVAAALAEKALGR